MTHGVGHLHSVLHFLSAQVEQPQIIMWESEREPALDSKSKAQLTESPETGRIKAQFESLWGSDADAEATRRGGADSKYAEAERAISTMWAALSTAIPQVSLLANSLFLAKRTQRSLSGEEARAGDCHRTLSTKHLSTWFVMVCPVCPAPLASSWQIQCLSVQPICQAKSRQWMIGSTLVCNQDPAYPAFLSCG